MIALGCNNLVRFNSLPDFVRAAVALAKEKAATVLGRGCRFLAFHNHLPAANHGYDYVLGNDNFMSCTDSAI